MNNKKNSIIVLSIIFFIILLSIGSAFAIAKTTGKLQDKLAAKSTGSPSVNTNSFEKEFPNEADFEQYMRKMQKNIKANWNPPKNSASSSVTLKYSIQKNGELKNVSVIKSSGDEKIDFAAVKSLKMTAPFEPLPDSFKGNHIDIQFTFDYNGYANGKEKL